MIVCRSCSGGGFGGRHLVWGRGDDRGGAYKKRNIRELCEKL